MTILTIANQKGGVGKTIVAVTIVRSLALSGLRTLPVDLGRQRHVVFSWGIPKATGFYNLIIDEAPIMKVAFPTKRGNFETIPGDKHTEKANVLSLSRTFQTRLFHAP